MSHRRLLARLGLLCGGLLVGCALAEVTARLIQPNGSSDLLFGAPEATPEGLYVHDPSVMMKPAPGFEATSGSLGYSVPLRINSLGLRGPELSPDDPTRWLATGDSFTMAAQVREERTFLALAGQTLDISFLNAGVDGYSTWQALRRYEQLDDTVGASGVLHTLFLGNDLADNERSGPAPSSTPAPHLVPGEPMLFGKDLEKGLHVECCETSIVGKEEATTWKADTASPVPGFLLAQLDNEPDLPNAIGIFRQVEQPTYDGLITEQIDQVTSKKGKGTLKSLIYTPDAWTVD